jgi:hypothetical protein
MELFEFSVDIPPTWRQVLKADNYTVSNLLECNDVIGSSITGSRVSASALNNIVKALL